MTEAEARERAERICDEMEVSWGMDWMMPGMEGPTERDEWIDKITAALLEASKEKPE